MSHLEMDDKIRNKALELAKKVLDKELDADIGCDYLAELAIKNRYTEELDGFTGLSHEQRGHEHLGLALENTKPLIIEECEEFVNNNS